MKATDTFLNDMKAQSAVRELLKVIGEDPDREGLVDTPKRVVKALLEMTSGYHMMAFEGVAWIGYLPDVSKGDSRVVGLSKLARLLDMYAKRLQIQERLTVQIADDIEKYLKPLGAGVVLKARHTCQCYRGVKKDGKMVTSAMHGVFKTDSRARSEFFQLVEISDK
jgi:GTP cyclohydrolase I